MTFIVYARDDPASYNVAVAVRNMLGFEVAENINSMPHWRHDKLDMLELGLKPFEGVHNPALSASFLDELLETELIILLSKHSSATGRRAFTVHAEGNWSADNKLGGEPKQLSVAAPEAMLAVLIELSRLNINGMEATYEATHHGPLLKTPSLFVELGGDESTINDRELAGALATAVVNALGGRDYSYKGVALGIGGTHYPRKFTQSALDGEYAFAHIMPKYHVKEADMLGQALERSNIKPEVAVIEWKSVNSSDRISIINKLNEMGLDYVRV